MLAEWRLGAQSDYLHGGKTDLLTDALGAIPIYFGGIAWQNVALLSAVPDEKDDAADH